MIKSHTKTFKNIDADDKFKKFVSIKNITNYIIVQITGAYCCSDRKITIMYHTYD